MGYTHYWYREKEIEKNTMLKIVQDFKKMLPIIEHLGIQLADGFGEKTPVIDLQRIWFNGKSKCGHLKNEEITIPWPSKEAGGVAEYTENVKSGNWFAGAKIDKRCCDGDCSYETVNFPKVITKEYMQQDKDTGLFFECCKTAYRPYDLALNILLIIATHYLKDKIEVHSDGEMTHWQEGMMLCQIHLGYGLKFILKK